MTDVLSVRNLRNITVASSPAESSFSLSQGKGGADRSQRAGKTTLLNVLEVYLLHSAKSIFWARTSPTCLRTSVFR
jgi:hypothetical protein